MSLHTKIILVNKIDNISLKRMYQIFQKYYDKVSFEQFLSDLADKTHLIMMYDAKSIVGFSTAFIGRQKGIRATIIYSGDTVLEKNYWGSKILQSAFYKLMLMTILRSGLKPVYWMLMSKGYKTYLLMRKNFSLSFPNPLTPTPKNLLLAKNLFYQSRFGSQYKEQASLVQFTSSKGQLKDGVAVATAKDMQNIHIKYFVDMNPGASRGDELACIAQLRWFDLIYTGFKHLKKWATLASKQKAAKNPLTEAELSKSH